MREGRWYHDPSMDEWQMVEPEEVPSGVRLEPKYRIESHNVRLLLEALDAHGWIKPRLDDIVRQDDVRIIHRLIDVLEKRK